MNETAISYKVKNKNNIQSYILGSIHTNMSPTEYQILIEKITPLIEACDIVYLECLMPNHIQLPFGYEKAVLEIISTLKEPKQVDYFESLEFQQAMLASSIWLGTCIKTMPWFSYTTLTKHPKLFHNLSKVAAILCKTTNIAYNLMTHNAHSHAVQQFLQESQKKLIKIYTKFQQGKIELLDDEENKRYLIAERNEHMASIILKNLQTDKKYLYVVGAAHLPGEIGIIHQLQQNNTVCEENDFQL